MTGAAIVMMTLFMLVIWGGLALSIIHLQKHPDETSGHLGDHPDLSNEALQKMERH
ncbi:methionine/alanine import NSS transporter subunit MetS [Corynebacterium poyangense]|uniref:Methionine/alanine import NSS transporter subunit MetS n=1 Tax=Corynebacterium poyangense TaxID=2684405 RepID=A0A7H0SQF7_9CORY|nr:methionine/alanine import NSS transporter subunit MetS [Corynebacterium poyangense]MBZ8178333.1 methionine/alanine import NSS transporter subunit MetS [Corynebacterium poyangense]QNQ90782.1 methionine/alanine import NSS transporter subunit MetS [Corynebacterium poyangense]